MSDAGRQKINVDLAAIPKHAQEELAGAVLDGVLDLLRQPGGREYLDKLKEERRNRYEENNACSRN